MRTEVDDAWPWTIQWSDERHFSLNRAVYDQNGRTWDSPPPNILHQQPQHTERSYKESIAPEQTPVLNTLLVKNEYRNETNDKILYKLLKESTGNEDPLMLVEF